MLASLASLTVATALAQAPASGTAEAAWLKVVPAEAEVVIRLRGIGPARDDLVKMIDAMSPKLGQSAKPFLEDQLNQALKDQVKGALDTDAPILVALKLPKAGAAPGELPPLVILVKADDYAKLQKTLAESHGSEVKKGDGGIDTIPLRDGLDALTYKGKGFVAVSNDRDMLRAVIKPTATFDSKLDADLRARLLEGDLGAYVNLAAVQAKYGDQIEQAKQQFMATLEQGGAAMGEGAIEGIKEMYGQVFDSLKNAEALAINLDAAAAGLTVGGEVTLKGGTKADGAKPGTGDALANLPADALAYVYSKVSPETFTKFQGMAMSMMYPGQGQGGSPAAKKALDLQKQAGIREMLGYGTMAKGGLRGMYVYTYDDPRKGIDSMTAMMKAMKGDEKAALNFIKDVTIEPDARKYKGFTFTKATSTIDQEKVNQLGGPSGGAIKAMMGDRMTSWYGTDGKHVVQITAPTWDEARAQLDAFQSGAQGIGKSAGYRLVRSKLPAQVNTLVLLSAQGYVRMIFTAMSPMMPGMKAPEDLPKEPALMGFGLTRVAKGYQFRVVVPSAVGPVFEQAIAPIFQGAKGAQGVQQ